VNVSGFTFFCYTYFVIYSFDKYKILKYAPSFSFFFPEFAASEPVVGLPEGTLLQYFSQLRQLLDLFMSWDWPTYFHDYGHDSSKYNLVTPNMAVLLLEKYVFIYTCIIIFLHDV